MAGSMCREPSLWSDHEGPWLALTLGGQQRGGGRPKGGCGLGPVQAGH